MTGAFFISSSRAAFISNRVTWTPTQSTVVSRQALACERWILYSWHTCHFSCCCEYLFYQEGCITFNLPHTSSPPPLPCLVFSFTASRASFIPEMDQSHFYNACNCSVGLDSTKLISTRALMNEEIGYRFSVAQPCDWSAFRSCVGQCVIFFPAFSNDFDLSLPPNVPSANGTSLNDLLCSELTNSDGSVGHSFASRAHLYATLKCFVNDASVDLNAAQFMSGSLMFSQQLVNCHHQWTVTPLD